MVWPKSKDDTMRGKSKHIPVNSLPSGIREGIMIMKIACDGPPNAVEVERPHRDNGHLFIFQEAGKTNIEIDFQTYAIAPSTIIYIHPDQVHRVITFENAMVTSWIITNENLSQENVDLLTALRPVGPLLLESETRTLLSNMAALCIKFAERKQEKLFSSILKESCNTLVTLVASQYLAEAKNANLQSRSKEITKSFNSLLEENFKLIKSPTQYADTLNISTPYLNQCIKITTGHPISYHIQERVILEAKRLLYHSNKSIKEIAAELGYDDFSYFSRLFLKVAGCTPLSFRNKIFE